MRLHTGRLALVITASLAACRSDEVLVPSPLPADSEIAVDFHTDKTQYATGASAKTTMVNHSQNTLTMGVCNDVLERAAGAIWVEIPPPAVACIALAVVIVPGDSATLSLDLSRATIAGTYRVFRHFSVAHGTTAETAYRRTNTFVVTR